MLSWMFQVYFQGTLTSTTKMGTQLIYDCAPDAATTEMTFILDVLPATLARKHLFSNLHDSLAMSIVLTSTDTWAVHVLIAG